MKYSRWVYAAAWWGSVIGGLAVLSYVSGCWTCDKVDTDAKAFAVAKSFLLKHKRQDLLNRGEQMSHFLNQATLAKFGSAAKDRSEPIS